MRTPGAVGLRLGLSGREAQSFAIGWIFAAMVAVAVTAFNIMTRRHERPDEPLALPLVLEGSSFITSLFAFAIPGAMAIWVTRTSPPWWRALGVHALALTVYFALHVGGFTLLRALAFALAGQTYHFGPLSTQVPYEFAKDLIAYVLAAGCFWLMMWWRNSFDTPSAAAPIEGSFDIRDGARLLRVKVADIVAVRSAGNYVEFVLTDGRRPLMRAALSALETELAQKGFVRTHRSWLVNAAQVTGLRPEGSGDYAIELGALEVPLSRRWRSALETLRA